MTDKAEIPENLKPCSMCGYLRSDLQYFSSGENKEDPDFKEGHLCSVCVSTVAGAAYFNPVMYKFEYHVLQMISFLENKRIDDAASTLNHLSVIRQTANAVNDQFFRLAQNVNLFGQKLSKLLNRKS